MNQVNLRTVTSPPTSEAIKTTLQATRLGKQSERMIPLRLGALDTSEALFVCSAITEAVFNPSGTFQYDDERGEIVYPGGAIVGKQAGTMELRIPHSPRELGKPAIAVFFPSIPPE